MASFITADDVRRHWTTHQEIALIDVREEGPYSLAHPLFAISILVSEVERSLPRLVPRLSVPIAVYDDGEGYAARAASRIRALGYSSVAILAGGLSAYARVGEVYRDVNVPSKAFGELVEAISHTPSMAAADVHQILQDDTEDVVVLDARRFAEYQTMSIPRAVSCPGGELVHRILEAAPAPTTRVFVHCAGRTRSILGTQSLLNAGVPNEVVAIWNGTIGWLLAGLALEHDKALRVSEPSPASKRRAREHAVAWSNHVGVSTIASDKLRQFVAESGDRTLHLLDVRTPEEYAAGHLPHFESAPGGQLVQATDEWVGQMGWDVYVFQDSSTLDIPAPPQRPLWSPPGACANPVQDLSQLTDAIIVDLARSPVYRNGHIPGSWYASGPALARDLQALPPPSSSSSSSATVVLTSPDGLLAAANLAHARSATSRQVVHLAGGTAAWARANGGGAALETRPRWLSEPIDVYKRPYEGTESAREDMQAYLDWEGGLVAQLANDGVASFRVVRGKAVQKTE